MFSVPQFRLYYIWAKRTPLNFYQITIHLNLICNYVPTFGRGLVRNII